MTCSAPPDCAEIERRHATGIGLLADGGASRGNLLSGEADHVILTVSRMEAEKRANPGYRAFFANGYNVTRTLVLFVWEVMLELDRRCAAAAARRQTARPPRRHVRAHARRDVRRRPRPDRLRRAQRHDEGASRRLRDVLELRRGRAPLRPRAAGHARGAAQARPAVRPHRRRPPLRAAAVLDRRALRPRADAGRDVQAAKRLRRSRISSRRSVAAATVSRGRRRRREPDGVGNAVGEATGTQAEAAEERRLRRGGRRPRLREPRADLPDGRAAAADARGDRRAPPGPDSRASRSTRTSAGCSCARERTARSRSAPSGARYLAERQRRGRGPAGGLLAERRRAPAAHGRLRARRRHHGRQLLRPGAGARAARSRS